MKKILYSTLAIAALAACNKIDNAASLQNDAFRIEVATPSVKANFNEETYAVTWREGEQLHVLVNETPYTFTKVADSQTAFECADFTPVAGTTYNYEVLTPYRSDYGEGVFTYSGGVKVTMYGKGTAVGAQKPSIQMNHLTALIRTNIANTGEVDLTVNSIRVESDTDNMGGRYKISNGELTPVNPVKYTLMESQNLTIKAGETKAMYVQCAPFTTTVGSKLTFTIVAGSDSFKTEKTMTKGVVFTAGKVNSTNVEIKKEAPAVDASDKGIYVDFGPTGSSYECGDAKWNLFSSVAVCDPVALNKADGKTASGLSLAVTEAFTTTFGGNGAEPGDLTKGGITFPKLVWKDALKVTGTTTVGKLEISGCTAGAKYTIKTLSARYNGSFGVRLAKISIGEVSNQIDCGGKSQADLDSHEFISVFENVVADANGKIAISVAAVKGTSTVVEGHINAMVIIPE